MFLDDLNKKERTAIEATGDHKSFAKGDRLIEEGVAGKTFFLIKSGRVEVRKRIDDISYKRLVILGPNDLVGEGGFLGIEHRTATVFALTSCDVVEFDREDIDQIITDNPLIGLKIY